MSIDQDAKLTYEHYVCIPDDGKRHEIIDGEHYVNPAPDLNHQTISRRIQFQRSWTVFRLIQAVFGKRNVKNESWHVHDPVTNVYAKVRRRTR